MNRADERDSKDSEERAEAVKAAGAPKIAPSTPLPKQQLDAAVKKAAVLNMEVLYEKELHGPLQASTDASGHFNFHFVKYRCALLLVPFLFSISFRKGKKNQIHRILLCTNASRHVVVSLIRCP